MKTKYLLFFSAFILFLAFLPGCNQKSATENSGPEETTEQEDPNVFFTIDFAEIIKTQRDVLLSEIAESVEYIPLENTGKSILGNVFDVQLTKEYIFIKHNGSRLLTQYNRNGKFIRHIGTEGRGPKEYALIRIFSLDEKNGLIYIHTNWTRKILVYNFNGEYVKTLKFKAVERGEVIWSRDSLFITFGEPQVGNEPFVFIEHNENGDTLQTIANHNFWNSDETSNSSVSIWGQNIFYRVENKLHIKSWYNDTVYTYNEHNKIVPEFFVDLKEHKIPNDLVYERKSTRPMLKNYYWTGINESDKYIFIRYGLHGIRKIGEGEYGCILYNKKIKEGVALKNQGEEYGFTNDLNGGPDFKPRYSNDSLIFVDVTAIDMKQYLDSEKFKNQTVKFPEQKEKLVELNKTLKEDDNHFLMIARLK